MTPLELALALEDHESYWFFHSKEQMKLTRHIGTVLRNKGVKQMHQIRDPRRLYKLWFERSKDVEVPTPEQWKKLDKRYIRPTSTN